MFGGGDLQYEFTFNQFGILDGLNWRLISDKINSDEMNAMKKFLWMVEQEQKLEQGLDIIVISLFKNTHTWVY